MGRLSSELAITYGCENALAGALQFQVSMSKEGLPTTVVNLDPKRYYNDETEETESIEHFIHRRKTRIGLIGAKGLIAVGCICDCAETQQNVSIDLDIAESLRSGYGAYKEGAAALYATCIPMAKTYESANWLRDVKLIGNEAVQGVLDRVRGIAITNVEGERV